VQLHYLCHNYVVYMLTELQIWLWRTNAKEVWSGRHVWQISANRHRQ